MTALKNFLTNLSVFIIPLLSILVMVLIFYIPRYSEFWNLLRSVPFYTGIYFWISQRPDAFNSVSAFVLGTFADITAGTPLGVGIITFLVLYFCSLHLSAYFNVKKFAYSWLLFILLAGITLLFKGLLVCAFYRSLIPLKPLVFEFLLVSALYPLLTRFYIWTERRFIHLEERYEKI